MIRALGILVAAVGLSLAAPAAAEFAQEGDLRVEFGGGISPSALPRSQPAPVGIHVSGGFGNLAGDRDSLPQLRTISVAINRSGRFFDRGLPTCDARLLQPGTPQTAMRLCGDALIGRGQVALQVRLAPQPPFSLHARLLVFHGPSRAGHRLIFAQAYAPEPPGSFVLTFRLTRHRSGPYGTVMTTRLPRSAWNWAYLEGFEMSLRRTYGYRGTPRSLLSAACHAPPGFRSALFPFAEATYGFADGRSLEVPIARSCKVSASRPQ